MQAVEKRVARASNQKRICFIEPPYHTFIEDLDAPFSLMYLAAVAEKCGWNAQILDMETLHDPVPEADIYGVTSSSPQWPDTIRLSERLANEFPESLTIIGGNHISADPEGFKDTSFHSAVLGEGEVTLSKILDFYPDLYPHAYSGEHIEDLDEIPFPARHLVDWSKYKRGIYWGKELLAPAVSMITSRGCPYNCVFCGSHVVFGREARFRSVQNVVSEIVHVIDTLGYGGFNFHDDTFCLNRQRVIQLCDEFAKLNIVWRCLTRADTVDEKMLGAMAKAGCKEIILGVESGSQTVLDRLRKGVTVAQNLRAMQLIKKAGIQLKVGVIVGSPGETWVTVEETKQLLKACPPDYWNVSVFTPFPGSAAWKEPEKHGVKILTRNLREYAMVGKDFKGNVVVETEKMTKQDIESARDYLIDFCLEISPQ